MKERLALLLKHEINGCLPFAARAHPELGNNAQLGAGWG
jgi:hypothetical protein